MLPCGSSDLPGLDTVKLYCPNCMDTYMPPSSRYHGIDGAFFGTTFPHLLLQCCRDLAPSILAPLPSAMDATEQESCMEDASKSASLSSKKPTVLSKARLGRKEAQADIYTPRIYGFRVSEFAPSGPRMQWMRMRPQTLSELDS